jgi:class 3 adenylate cyclase
VSGSPLPAGFCASDASLQDVGHMSKSVEPMRTISDAPGADLSPRARRALHEARTEAVVVLAVDVALFAGLASADKAKG